MLSGSYSKATCGFQKFEQKVDKNKPSPLESAIKASRSRCCVACLHGHQGEQGKECTHPLKDITKDCVRMVYNRAYTALKKVFGDREGFPVGHQGFPPTPEAYYRWLIAPFARNSSLTNAVVVCVWILHYKRHPRDHLLQEEFKQVLDIK